jgi:hypothetical protein
MDARLARLLTPALQDPPLGRPQAPPPAEVRGERQKEITPLPNSLPYTFLSYYEMVV